jgi:hypothetical protein
MNMLRAIPVVAFVALASGNALASSPAEVERFPARLPESDRPAGGARTVIQAPPELVKAVVLDFPHYALYFDPDKGKNPDRVWKSKVVGKSGGKTDLYLQVPILKGLAKIWAVIRFDAMKKDGDAEIMKGRIIREDGKEKGNVRELSAKWTVRTTERGTELQLEFLVVPGGVVPVPDKLLKDEAISAASKAVRGVRDEVLKRAAEG